jgi:iduronate 2-sulfatase
MKLVTLLFSILSLANAKKQLNVLYLISDDLRTELNTSYKQDYMITPHFDRLANEGLTFGRAYCQQAVCAASRTSFMTGRRPQRTRNYGCTENGKCDFRHAGIGGKDWVTMPQHFKNQGYQVLGGGKTFHKGLDGTVNKQGFDIPTSWTSNWPTGKPYTYFKFEYANVDSPGKGKCPETSKNHVSGMDGYFHDDKDESTYYDYQLANHTIDLLNDYAKYAKYRASNNAINVEIKPFFFMAGFARPHAPWRVPTKFYNLYKDFDTLAANKLPYKGMPPIAFRSQGAYNEKGECAAPHMNKSMPDDMALEWRRHYYAAVSFIDAQIGRILDALQDNGLADNTIVVMHSDHGWQLGENGIWHKQTNFDLAARVPLIIKVPNSSSAGKRTDSLAELVDMYPTVAELAGVDKPSALDGVSLASLFENSSTKIKNFAFGQFPHSLKDIGSDRKLLSRRDDSGFVSAAESKDAPCDKNVMGFTVRSDQYRYTRWMPFGQTAVSEGKLGCVDWSTPACAEELYDHAGDDGSQLDKFENENLKDAQPETVKDLYKQLVGAFNLSTCDAPKPPGPTPPTPPAPPTPPTPSPGSPCKVFGGFQCIENTHCSSKPFHSGEDDLESCAALCSKNKDCICFDHTTAGSSGKSPACRMATKSNKVKPSSDSYVAYARDSDSAMQQFV